MEATLWNEFTLLPTRVQDSRLREMAYLREWTIDQKQVAPLLWHPGA